MARAPRGPLGNAPRDDRDDFVGEPAEEIKAGPPLRWPPNPKKITKDTFHAKVEGKTAQQRADRSPTFRKGGWVSGYARGGATKKQEGGTVGFFGGESFGKQWQRENREAQERKFEASRQRAEEEAKRQSKRAQSSSDDIDDSASDNVAQRKAGGVLTAAKRQSLPKSSFALPGKGKGPKGAGAGSYPIPNPSHARNALARVSQHGTSEEKAKVRAAVHRKYPNIGQKE